MTVHYKSHEWVKVQYDFISKYISECKTYAYVDESPTESWPFKFDFDFRRDSKIKRKWPAAEHGSKLDNLVKCLNNPVDDDILIFLDGDSFPIYSLDQFIFDTLTEYQFISIVRKEMNHSFPHPSFAMCRYKLWKEYKLTWLPGCFNNIRVDIDDPGVTLQKQLESNKIKWKQILRTRSLSTHPIFFGIYGNLIYHHTAGFRPPTTRWDADNFGDTLQEKRIENAKISKKILNELQTECYDLLYKKDIKMSI